MNTWLRIENTPAIVSDYPAPAVAGEYYEHQFEVSGLVDDDYSWAWQSGMPPSGITLDPHTGLFSGVTEQTGPFPMQVVALGERVEVGQSFVLQVTSDPTEPPVEPPEPPVEPPPGQSTGNEYWNELCRRSDFHMGAALRTQEEIERYTKRENKPNAPYYDGAKDAQCHDTNGIQIAGNVQTHIHFGEIKSGNMMAVWEHRWDPGAADYARNIAPMQQNKTWQLADRSNSVCCEPKTWWMPEQSNPNACHRNGLRVYPWVLDPNTNPVPDKKNPLNNHMDFPTAPDTWTRTWVYLDFAAKEISMWMADTSRDPVTIYDRVKMAVMSPGVAYWWVELNSSQGASGKRLDVWNKNFCVLKDIANGHTGAQSIVNQSHWK